MLLEDKVAVVYGAAGAIGGAIARTFAREGAHVHLAGRTRKTLETVAAEITAAGGRASVAVVDALDEESVRRHAADVVAGSGRIDVSVNAIGLDHEQGLSLRELALQDYLRPITAYTTTQFLTATAAARHMAEAGRGVVLTISTTASQVALPVDGFGPACAAVEAFSRQLAGELGPHGVRVVCLRSDGIAESVPAGSHVGVIFRRMARRFDIPEDEMLADPGAPGRLLANGITLADVAETATFLASDRAAGVTAAIANVSAGSVLD
jgi:3-oxoacyl-[acyl-carrier protein] reductase